MRKYIEFELENREEVDSFCYLGLDGKILLKLVTEWQDVKMWTGLTWVRSRDFTVAGLKTAVFWDVASCSLVDVYRRFRGVWCLHHEDDGGRELISVRQHDARTHDTAIWINLAEDMDGLRGATKTVRNIPYS
jgi:hypothetical protein